MTLCFHDNYVVCGGGETLRSFHEFCYLVSYRGRKSHFLHLYGLRAVGFSRVTRLGRTKKLGHCNFVSS